MEIATASFFIRFTFLVFLLLLVQFRLSLSCSGSTNALDKRGPRKALMLEQNVPDTPEDSQQASGPSKGKITRNSPEFDKLKPCYNNAIIFKDEEGTGADRLMSKRCQDKLNTLADLVRRQWPTVKLVVTEAWDEQGQHSENSLHYEGRAVDLRLSDKDRTKIGYLGRLAVDAGFDWVYYQKRTHIHASVREDGYKEEAWGGCFSSDSVVKLENGADLRVRNLQIGDIVQVMTEEGKLGYSEIVMFADFKPDIPRASHVLIETENPAKRITLTPSHLIFTTSNSSESRLKSKQAGKVLPGEFLQVSSQGKLVPSLVRRVSVVKRTGMVAPVTMQGNVIVDGVLCSCYAMIADHDIAHTVFSPLRLVHSFASNLWRMDMSIQQGMHWYPGLLMKINALLGIYELS